MLNNSIMLKEIYDQEYLVKVTHDTNKELIKEVANKIMDFKPVNVLLVARGTSYHAGEYLKQKIELHLGIPVSVASLSTFTIYDQNLKLDNTLVIGISQSGGGRDIHKALEKAKEAGALVVTITNNKESIVAKTSDYNLDTNLGKCEAYAATKSYLSTMYLIDLLMYHLTNDDKLNIEVDKVINHIKEGLSFSDEINLLVKDLENISGVFIMGRGLDVTLGLELALKMKETSKIHTSAYSIGEFYHGPLVMNMDNVANIVFSTSDITKDDAKEMIKVFNDFNAYSLAITNNKEVADLATKSVHFKCNNPLYAKYIAIVILQLYTNYLAVLKGFDTDKEEKFKLVDTF